MQYNSELALAKQLATAAGKIMLRYFRADDIGSQWKEDDSPITIADVLINNLVIEKIKQYFPLHGVLGEEASYKEAGEWVWVCDPIDGTVPFSLGMPNATFCVALTKHGRVVLSVIYDPFQDQMFHAVCGEGAFLNNTPIRVSPNKEFKQNYVSGYSGLNPDQGDLSSVEFALRQQGAKFLGMPSYSYIATRVATGEMLAAYMTYGAPWDAAAISLIVEEAGGRASDLKGNQRDYLKYGDGILVSNGLVHDKILGMIEDANSRH